MFNILLGNKVLKMKRLALYLAITFALMFIVNCSSISPNIRFADIGTGSSGSEQMDNEGDFAPTGDSFTGKASFYHDKFNGRKTSNGEIFSNHKYTCAHKTLPFGTMLKVTNMSTGQSVLVKVNDRGPFVRGRILDLSKAAARQIGMIQDGVATVKIEIMN